MQLLRAYIHSALGAVQGYKALVVDKDTMRMCSMLCGRSELAERDVVHVEQLDHPTSSKRSHQELKVRFYKEGQVFAKRHQFVCC